VERKPLPEDIGLCEEALKKRPAKGGSDKAKKKPDFVKGS
jgi:hypothetical protein